jgi:protein tyrosine phosphatase (PTP) superfamily phosphohydrolase (DUF442 family)
MITKYTPFDLSKNTLEGIYNYYMISETIATSGQPTEKQFNLIKEAGYKTIINLAPHSAENSLPDETSLLNKLGLKYSHIPVDFKNPTDENFTQFVVAMNKASTEKTWVHCAANMRVSAFIYKYRCEVLKENSDMAKSELEEIWEPLGVWKEFVSKT